MRWRGLGWFALCCSKACHDGSSSSRSACCSGCVRRWLWPIRFGLVFGLLCLLLANFRSCRRQSGYNSSCGCRYRWRRRRHGNRSSRPRNLSSGGRGRQGSRRDTRETSNASRSRTVQRWVANLGKGPWCIHQRSGLSRRGVVCWRWEHGIRRGSAGTRRTSTTNSLPCSRILCHHLLFLENITTARHISSLNRLLCEGILRIAHTMQVGTIGVVTSNVLDERRAVFGSTKGTANSPSLVIGTIQRQDTSQRVLLFVSKMTISYARTQKESEKKGYFDWYGCEKKAKSMEWNTL